MKKSDFKNIKKEYDVLFIGYENAEGEYNEFDITDISNLYKGHSNQYYYFDAWCINKDGEIEDMERTFRVDRVEFAEESNVEYDGDEDDEDEYEDEDDEEDDEVW